MDAINTSEILAGVWFFINLFCLMVFFKDAYEAIAQNRALTLEMAKFMVLHRTYERGTQASVALTVYFTGATIRAAYSWFLLLFERVEWDSYEGIVIYDPHMWVRFVAAIFAVLGGLCILRVFTHLHWGHRAYVLAGVISIIVPIAVHYI